MKKYYAVKKGKKVGVFDSWEECKDQVLKVEGAIYKSFSTKEEALAFLKEEENVEEEIDSSLTPIAYVDGSYNVKTNEYSFGAVLLYQNQMKKFKHKFEEDIYSKYRNVAGEVRGASFIIQYAIKNGIKELHLYYDYKGIEDWFLGNWKANTDLTKLYTEFAQKAKNQIVVHFHKVKSHTNNYYNDMVDLLAKEALGL